MTRLRRQVLTRFAEGSPAASRQLPPKLREPQEWSSDRALREIKNDDRKPRQFTDAGPESKASLGSGMAPVAGDYSAPNDHRSSRLWESLEAPRRPALDL